MITTIPRNHTKKIAALAARLTVCTVHTLESGFAGETCKPSYAWERLYKTSGARLTSVDDAKYVIQIHGNCWYELTEAPASVVTPEPAAAGRYARNEAGAFVFVTQAGRSTGRVRAMDGTETWRGLAGLTGVSDDDNVSAAIEWSKATSMMVDAAEWMAQQDAEDSGQDAEPFCPFAGSAMHVAYGCEGCDRDREAGHDTRALRIAGKAAQRRGDALQDTSRVVETVADLGLRDTSRVVEIVPSAGITWEDEGTAADAGLWLGNCSVADGSAILQAARLTAGHGRALRVSFPSVMTFHLGYDLTAKRYVCHVPGGDDALTEQGLTPAHDRKR